MKKFQIFLIFLILTNSYGKLASSQESEKSVENSENSSENSKSAENSTESDSNSVEGVQEDEDGTIHVDLLDQKKHVGDIVQLWDESEIDGNMRNALRSSSNQRWTNQKDTDGKYVIPYVITGNFNSNERQIIQRGMDVIARNTCIRFKPRQGENDYVDIQNKKDEGCYTTVGRLRGRQVLMLETGWQKSCGTGCVMRFPGCVEHSTVVHELFHKIGLWHEQMRYDRDKYIKIVWGNIVPGFQSQFDKVGERQSTTFNLPYDFQSVMHYGRHSGARRSSKPGEKLTTMAMQPGYERYADVIGSAKDASNQDYQKICSIYQCSTCMGRSFSPLRSMVEVEREEQTSPQNGTNPAGTKCEPLNVDCDKGIRPGHSLYNLYCCPKCDECKPKNFCTDIDAESQKNLYDTFCCGRCAK